MRKQALRKLLSVARKACREPDEPRHEPAPFGFAARVASRWSSIGNGPDWRDLLERFCWWGAGASVAVCLLACAYDATRPEPDAFDLVLNVQQADAQLP